MKSILSVCLLLVFYCAKAQNTAEEFYEKAKLKNGQQDYQYAATLIDKAILLNDTNMWYWLQKADILLNLKYYSDIIPTLKKAMFVKPKHPEPYSEAGYYYEATGQPDSAIYMYNLAIKFAKVDSIKSSYLMNRGTVKTMYRDFKGALADYKEAIVLSPGSSHMAILSNMANTYKDLGDTIKAIETMKEVISLAPSFVGSYVNLGLLYSETDSLDKSLQCFNKALELEPNEALAFNNRGFTYYKMKRYKDALKDVNKSIEMYPSNSFAYKNLALIYFAQNNISEGCTALSYAERYGFEVNYGDEVKKLQEKYCKK